jgi:hypothetical protein
MKLKAIRFPIQFSTISSVASDRSENIMSLIFQEAESDLHAYMGAIIAN